MDKKKIMRALFFVGLVVGIVAGEAMHHLAMGVCFGILLGLILRELYERKTDYR